MRGDDQVVETFLHVYEDGRFSRDPDWLPQHQANVEVVASSEDGTRLAIEHTKLFEFPIGQQANPDEDEMLAAVGASLQGVSLPVSDRVFMLSVEPRNLRKLLAARRKSKALEALTEWAQRELPALREKREFEVEIPGNLPREARIVRIAVEVWKTRSNRPILGCGYLPPKSSLSSLVRKAFEEKLPKLSAAKVQRRILMLEVVTLDGDSDVYEAVRNLATDFPQFLAVDEVVFVRNFLQLGAVVFRTWNTTSNESSVVIAQVSDL
ncbi:MAG: hypothetical protein ACLQBK_10395 [Candidatus Sulfotelmatobacter sp.]